MHQPFDPIAHVRYVEVEPEAKAVATQAQIREKLRFVDREQRSDSFDFDNDALLPTSR